MCNNNRLLTQTRVVESEIMSARGRTLFIQKEGYLRKIAVLGLAIVLMFGGRVWQMFFVVLFLLRMCNNNIDSERGVDIEIPLARGQTLFT